MTAFSASDATLEIPKSEQRMISHSSDGKKHFFTYANQRIGYYILAPDYHPDMEIFFGINPDTGTFFLSDSIPPDIRKEILIIEWSRQASENKLYAQHIKASLQFDSGTLGLTFTKILAIFFQQILATYDEVQDEDIGKQRDIKTALDICNRYHKSRSI